MHHPRSIHDARRLRITGLLLIGSRLLMFGGCGSLFVSFLTHDRNLMIFGSGFLILSFMLTIAQWISSSQARCPLCRTSVLAPMGCMKHRRARSLLGSYRMRVAFAIMFTAQFRCPYCNESTAMDVVEKLNGSRPRGHQTTKFSKFY